MRHDATLAALVAAASLLAPAAAADFSDPTWPCIQRKVEELSAGVMWPAPIEAAELDPGTQGEVEELAETLALRRVGMEQAEEAVASFLSAHPEADQGLMAQVFLGVFETLARERRRIMTGIADYAAGQADLSDRIEAARQQMSAEMAKEEPDYDRADALEEQLDWDERIFTDRARSLEFLCETPVLLEKRLYAIAQLVQEAAG